MTQIIYLSLIIIHIKIHIKIICKQYALNMPLTHAYIILNFKDQTASG